VSDSSTTTTGAIKEDPASLPFIVLAGLLAGPFLTMLDSSVVNVAIPAIARSFNADLTTVQWTVSGYLLALASSLSASAWLVRRFGSRPVYVACMAGFTASSALCALAPSIQFLVGARVLQGLAGAALVPIAMSMTMNRSTARSSARASMAPAMMLFLAPALGPTLGGILIHESGWPSIFLVNLPFGVLGIFGALKIPARFNLTPDRSVRFDLVGLALLAVGLGLALYGAGQGSGHGWTSAGVWPFWAGGLLLVALYGLWAARRSDPVLNLDVLRDRQSAFSIAICVLVSVVSFAALFLIPVLMQVIQGYDAFQASLALLPQGVAMG
jgi:EmrB/QacA subfamily drug resistance transporter